MENSKSEVNSGEVRFGFVLGQADDAAARRAGEKRLAQLATQPMVEMMLEMQVRDLAADNEALRKRLWLQTWKTVMICVQIVLAVAIWWQPIAFAVQGWLFAVKVLFGWPQ